MTRQYLTSVTSRGRKVHAVADLTATDVATALCGATVAVHPGRHFTDTLPANQCTRCVRAVPA